VGGPSACHCLKTGSVHVVASSYRSQRQKAVGRRRQTAQRWVLGED